MRTPVPGRRRAHGVTVVLLAVLLAVSGVIVPSVVRPPARAAAVTGSQWNPGMIITDGLFYAGTSMTADQIQSFIASQYQGCDAGYTCLRDYRMATFTRPADGLCDTYVGAPDEPASLVLAKVGLACGVSPKALLVLLQKESSVVTSTSPNYRSATGYGCPDTAACDSRYYGFYNQVYMAAWQFKRYQRYPTQYGYVAGRSNYILYNPNRACGGSNVYIANQATAGLYIYTPYQPNAAALANLYGTGDGCSAYGNRNFWRLYNDWFGSTTVAAPQPVLWKTATDPRLYMVSLGVKYQIDNWDTYLALPASLQSWAVVPQSQLDSVPTGTMMHRIFHAADGAVYFFDSQAKLHIPTCQMIQDYGYDCMTWPTLGDDIIAQFRTAPEMTNLFTGTSGLRYEVQAGKKREVLDDASLRAANMSTATVLLKDSAIDNLPLGAPVVRDGVSIRNTTDGSVIFYRPSVGSSAIGASAYNDTVLSTALPLAGGLTWPSIAQLGPIQWITGFGKSSSGATFIATPSGRAPVDAADWGATFRTWPDYLVAATPQVAPLPSGTILRSVSSMQAYFDRAGTARPILTMDSLYALASDPFPFILFLSDDQVAELAKGPVAVGPGLLVKGADLPQYLVDGYDKKIWLTDAAIGAELGISAAYTTDQTAANSYTTVAGAAVSPAVRCGGQRYLGIDGRLHPVSATTAGALGLTFQTLQAGTCYTLLQHTGPAFTGSVLYVKASSGAPVYQLSGGQLHWVTSWDSLIRLEGTDTPSWVTFSDADIAAMTKGPSIS